MNNVKNILFNFLMQEIKKFMYFTLFNPLLPLFQQTLKFNFIHKMMAYNFILLGFPQMLYQEFTMRIKFLSWKNWFLAIYAYVFNVWYYYTHCSKPCNFFLCMMSILMILICSSFAICLDILFMFLVQNRQVF